MAYDVFISYRREGGGEVARLIYDRLKMADLTVSFDKDTLQSGNFNDELLKRIAECKNFVVILNKGCFDRTLQGVPREHDWLRIEIASALYNRKNIIPVRMPGFEFPEELPKDIDEIRSKNWVNYDLEYIDAVCAKLKDFMVGGDAISESAHVTDVERSLAGHAADSTVTKVDIEGLIGDDSDFVRSEALLAYQRIPRVLPYDELSQIDASWEGAEKSLSRGDFKSAIDGYLETLERARSVTPSSSAFVLRVAADGVDTTDKNWFAQVLKRAQDRDPDYQYGLGTLYAEGLGVRQDPAAAIRWFGFASLNGHPAGRAAMGAALLSGRGVEVDYVLGRELLEKADAEGVVMACERLGYLHEKGLGCDRDFDLAKKYYERAVENGCALAVAELGGLYERGDGVEPDSERAEALYLQAAEDDCALALRRLADRRFAQAKDDKTREEALSFCRRAVDQGDVEALVLLGMAYENGWGVAKDLKRAEELYLKAQKEGCPSAEIHLDELRAETQFRKGLLCVEGVGGKRDWQTARQWFTKASDQGHTMAMVWLGLLLQRGLGGAANAETASSLYLKAAAMGNPIGNLQAGRLRLRHYKHAKRDYDKAFAYFRQAATNWTDAPEEFRWWSVYAFNELGRCYNNAWGCKRDYLLAARFFRYAAKRGCVSACRNLAGLYGDGHGVGQDKDASARWHQEMWKLVKDGLSVLDDHAFCCLGDAVKAGDGVGRDLASAAIWWRRAVGLGNLSAVVHLDNTGRAHREILGSGDESVFLQAYLKEAEAGDAVNMSNVGLSYQFGHYGLPQDSKKAFEWFLKSADCGNSTAMRYLSDMYFTGEGVDLDRDKSLDWLIRASEADDVVAKRTLAKKYYGGTRLGRDVNKVRVLLEEIVRENPDTIWSWASLAYLYKNGIGVNEDENRATKYYQKVAEFLCRGAEMLDPSKQDDLADYYYWGKGLSKDVDRAADLYKKASDSDSRIAHASNMLRCIYRYGKLGVPDLAVSYAYAKRYFEKLMEPGMGAVRGVPSTCVNVGHCYRYGRGVEVDTAKAKDWYEKAAEKKSWSAMLNIAGMLRSGELGIPDINAAEEWERKAVDELRPLAENGADDAQRALGDRYLKGFGVEQNYQIAVKWYEDAYEVRNWLAAARLAKMLQFGWGVEKDESRALALLTKATEKDSSLAAGLLGECYEKGELGLKPDLVRAAELFRQSAVEGCACGLYNLGRCLCEGIGIDANCEEGLLRLQLASAQKGDFWGYDQKAAELLRQVENRT